MSGETISAAAGNASKIRFDDKAPRGVLILLYTVGHVTRPGIWEDGSGILGWAPMPEVDKAEREACYAQPHSGFSKPRSYKMTDQNKPSLPTMQAVDSSQIASMGHDSTANKMFVQFKNGSLYSYDNVDAARFSAIVGADSVGKAFNSLIKAQPLTYPYAQIS